jgi:hypothetical protein
MQKHPFTASDTFHAAGTRHGGWNGSMIRQAKGITMRKFKFDSTPAEQKAVTFAEGKQAFTEGQQRSYNPHTAHNLQLATIWWQGWDTGEEEESNLVQPAKKES